MDKNAECYFQSQSHCIFIETFQGIRKKAFEIRVDHNAIQQSFEIVFLHVKTRETEQI